ncbi:hypothetical protein J2S17_004857 [Cytobacillus purgationiresistens]|uniref:Butirosin biosynthesis protein H N-terminal domain-containing protein n=2 Tax=Cytobacillus purgationiresistens TaxID=863449 RepID=A0ABU0AP46_9BACI|nr:hypothetical protein [Cytobacillus purgationiresistens]
MEPVQDKRHHCYEAVQVTIAKWWNLEYYLLYSKSWGFEHVKFNHIHPELLGNRIYNGSQNVLDVELQIGMKIEQVNTNNFSQLKELITSEVKKGAPSIINMDAFFCPFHPVYQKQHLSHDFIILGIEDNVLTCLDPKFHLHHKKINLNFLEGKDVTVSTVKKSNVSQCNYTQLIKASLNQQIEKKISTFESIKNFAYEVRDGINIKDELDGFPLNTAPLIFQLSNTQYNREKFSIFLTYTNSKVNNPYIEAAINITNQVANDWKTVEHLILKSAFQKNPQNLFNRISDYLFSIYENENRLFSTLSKYVR